MEILRLPIEYQASQTIDNTDFLKKRLSLARKPKMHYLKALALLSLSISVHAEPEVSPLWGHAGEKWSPQSTLPDFSRAGYLDGADLPSDLSSLKLVSVAEFGAKPDDQQDDTAAFLKALQTEGGVVIFIPEGTYLLSDRLPITSSKTILRGESKDKTILLFTKGLEEVDPKPTQNSGGTPTTSYSWSGGFIDFRGSNKHPRLPSLSHTAKRGSLQLNFKEAPKMNEGDRILIRQYAGKSLELVKHLYAGDPGELDNMRERDRFSIVARIKKIQGNTLHLDRRLLCDVNPEWDTVITKHDPNVKFSGIENLSIAFPAHRYGGHFREKGYNAINLGNVSDCWVRNINIINADSGIFCSGSHCTIQDITISAPNAQATPATNAYTGDTTGHHGLTAGGTCNLFSNFHFETKFIHDLTVSHSSGNVFMDGKGVDLSIDHHKKAPFANLFTNIDLGDGGRFLFSGGGAKIGRHSGAWQTFWNIRAEKPVYINKDFGPTAMNFVGVKASNEKELLTKGFKIISTPVKPLNLYRSQQERFKSH